MSNLRQRFIEDAKQIPSTSILDFSVSKQVGQEGRFLNKVTHNMWLGYQMAHETGLFVDKTDIDESCVQGTYIIGNHIGPGVKMLMSRVPFVNKTRNAAYTEAKRLVEQYGGEFVVYRCVKTFTSPKDPV